MTGSSVAHSLLILNYNRPDLLRDRLLEINKFLANHSDLHTYILDNGGNGDAEQTFRDNHGKNQTFFRLKDNIGFGPGFNWLAARADGTFYYLLSDDVRIFGDFIIPIKIVLDANPSALICHLAISYPAGWNQFGTRTINYPAGYFIACTAGTWKRLGGFDERFAPNDYEDVDLGMKAQQNGIPLYVLRGLPIQHLNASTIGYSPARYNNTVIQRKKFAEKWSLPNIPEVP